MPLTPINYGNGVIYKIVCNDPTISDCYVGSTTNIVKRKQSHKYNCNNDKTKEYHYYVYQFIREKGGWNNWSLVLIENYPCNNKLELERRERYFIEELQATLNKKIPTQTNKEYKKKYNEENKDKAKTYREENKEHIAEMKQKYFEENKEKIYTKKSEEVPCECGCNISRVHLSRHRKTSKHINPMKLMEQDAN